MEKLFQKWKRQKLAEQALISLGIGLPLGSLSVLAFKLSFLPVAIIVSSFLILMLLLWQSGFFRVQLNDLAHFLNQNYPELEQSCDLLLLDKKHLNRITQLQRQQVGQKLQALKVRLPNQWGRAISVFITGILLSWGMHQVTFTPKTYKSAQFENKGINSALDTNQQQLNLPPKLVESKITITPPTYTRLPKRTTKTLEIEAPYGALLSWNLSFDPPISEGALILGDGTVLKPQQTNGKQLTFSTKLKKTTFYQIKFRTAESDWQYSDYYQIEIIEDQPPEIKVKDLPAYAEYVFNPDKTVSFQVRLQDDYGLTDAYLVATLSKGEGESVKFRDDTLQFDAVFKPQQKQYQLHKTLRLGDLNMEAGDELYLHVEAKDNQAPTPQTSKTYKYILSFEDPEQIQIDMAGGLAVNRMPEYFRSQRQIIIDTEKLIAQRSKLEAQAFNEESNNIAIDQKLLRLRYGRFLGEEFETAIGTEAEADHDEEHKHHGHDEEHKHFGPGHGHHDHEHDEDHEHHEHDHDHDHDAHPTSKTSEDQYLSEDHQHDHPENWGNASEDEEIKELEPYVHAHDVAEEVTYFDATTAAKLRVALAQMWDAELHLRMGNPEKALPYEYKALKLIKEIQQASRIYVERIGFDPPVIKVAEKRLTGDLKKVQNSALKTAQSKAAQYPNLRKAIPLMEQLKQSDRSITATERINLEAAGNELAALALEQPGRFLIALQKLRNIIDEQLDNKSRQGHLEALQKIAWEVLSDEELPVQNQQQPNQLKDIFLRELLNAN